MSQYVWGVDPAISHVSFAFAATDKHRDIDVESIVTRTEEREGARLGLLDRQLRIYARQIAAQYPPAVIWVEQPSGRFPNPQLFYAVGVIQAALYEALACPVWTIPSSAWKRSTVGHGNATKEQVAVWLQAQHIPFDTQDDADAICIALTGRAMLAAGVWEVAA